MVSVGDPAAAYLFGLGSNLSGVPVNETSALGSSAFWRGVNVLCSAVANLPLKSYRDLDDGSRGRVPSFLDDPAGVGSMTPYEWVETVMAHLAIHGNAFLVHVYGGADQLVGLQPVHPSSVGVSLDSDVPGEKVFNVSYRDGTQAVLTSLDLTHIPALTTDPDGRGFSVLSVLRNSLGTTLAGDQAAARLFANGMLISGLVTPLEDMTAEEAATIKDGLRAKILGVDNAGDIAVINRQLKFEKWSMTSEDAQFLESRSFQIDEVARALGVPPHLLMEMTKQSSWGTGLIEQNQAWARYTLSGWTTRIEQRLSRLLPQPRFCEFDYKGLLRPTPGEEINLLLAEVNGGLISLNEARDVLNLPPVAEGDTLRLPPGQVPPAEQSAPMDVEEPA